MPFSIRLDENERELVNAYAKLHSLSVAEAFKQALFEKIDEEYDRTVFDDAYDEYLENGKKSRPIGELFEEIGL